MHSRSLDSAEAIDLYYNYVISIILSSSEKHLPRIERDLNNI